MKTLKKLVTTISLKKFHQIYIYYIAIIIWSGYYTTLLRHCAIVITESFKCCQSVLKQGSPLKQKRPGPSYSPGLIKILACETVALSGA